MIMGNKGFLKVGEIRVRVSTINSYALVEFKGQPGGERFKIKIVTSRSSYLVPVRPREEGEEILRGVDEFLVFNNEE